MKFSAFFCKASDADTKLNVLQRPEKGAVMSRNIL